MPVSIGEDDDHKLKVWRIWNILNHPFLIASEKVLDKIKKYAAEVHKTKRGNRRFDLE